MRIALAAFAALLVWASSALAQGMPPPSRIDGWTSPKNQKRLSVEFGLLPDATPRKLPDGTTEPAKAPWPFVLYINDEESKATEKITANIFGDTRFAIATHACKLVRLKPSKAVDVPWLQSVPNLRDPTILVVDRDFKVLGGLREQKEFTANRALEMMARAADPVYPIKLAAYVTSWIEILKEGEKLWKEEKSIEEMTTRAGDKDKGKQEKVFKEVEEREKALAAAEDLLTQRELQTRDLLKARADQPPPVPTSVGSGKKKRPLTPQETEALATYREFSRNENPVVRAAAVEDLGSIDSEVMVAAILEASGDLDPVVLTACGVALGRMKSDLALEAIVEGLRGSRERAKIAAVTGLARIQRKYPPAVSALTPLASSPGDDLRRGAILALGVHGDASAAPVLVAALDDALPALRVTAATALGEIRAPEGAAALLQRVASPDWSLRKAVVEALGRIRPREAVGPLIERFEKEEGLMTEVVYKALVSITGEDFRLEPRNWRSWWERFGGAFQVPTDEQIAKAQERASHALDGYAKPDKVRYHKIETLSRKMVFLIDISSSMADKIVIPPEAPESVRQEFPDRVKMEIAKREMIALLSNIDERVYFNVIPYAGRVRPWMDTLVSASQRTAAIKMVSKLQAMPPPRTVKEGGEEQKTNTYAALLAAFGLADQQVPDWKARTQADTIFLVTDGLPTTGEIIDVPKLIDAITELNRTRGVVIHVITFDRIAAQRLKPLAERNGGQCVLRGF